MDKLGDALDVSSASDSLVPLNYALRSKNRDFLMRLLQHPGGNFSIHVKYPPLVQAIELGYDDDLVKELLNAGVDVHAIERVSGNSSGLAAAAMGRLSILKQLVSLNGDMVRLATSVS